MGSPAGAAKGLAVAAFGFACWMVGHVQGQAVGARDALDSDPEPYVSEFEIVDELHRHAHARGNGG